MQYIRQCFLYLGVTFSVWDCDIVIHIPINKTKFVLASEDLDKIWRQSRGVHIRKSAYF